MQTSPLPPEVSNKAKMSRLGTPYAQFEVLVTHQKQHLPSIIYTCADGLICKNTKTQDMQVIYWDRIDELYIESWREGEESLENGFYSTWFRCKFSLHCADKTIFNFVGTSEIMVLRHIIEKAVITHQLSSVTASYNAGKAITCGQLTISQNGVSNGEYTFTWDKILCIDFEGTFIRVRGYQWDIAFEVLAATTPNICVLEALVRYLQRQGKIAISSRMYLSPTQKFFIRKARRLSHLSNLIILMLNL